MINELKRSIADSITYKNKIIRNLEYLVTLSTKAYNDALKVYEAKLNDLNIDKSSLDFQYIDYRASTMPAGLVAKY